MILFPCSQQAICIKTMIVQEHDLAIHNVGDVYIIIDFS